MDKNVRSAVDHIDLRKARLISISAVSYLTGRQHELKEIAEFCHQHDIYVCYDAIQAVGQLPFNVKENGADFVALGAQKWLLGVVGAGILYARKELLEELFVPFVGWTSVKYPENFSLKELDFAPEMSRFEAGLPNILPIAALNQSLRDMQEYGWENIFSQVANHTRYLTAALNDHQIQTFAQHDDASGIVSFTVPDKINKEKLAQGFAENNIYLTQRENYIRVSPHFYNSSADIDRFLALLKIRTKGISGNIFGLLIREISA